MINKLQRMELMQELANYNQWENLPAEELASFSQALLKDDNIQLHKLITALSPKTEGGIRFKEAILAKICENEY